MLLGGVEFGEMRLTSAPLLADEPPLLAELDTWPGGVLPGHSRSISLGENVVVSLLASVWLVPAAWAPQRQLVVVQLPLGDHWRLSRRLETAGEDWRQGRRTWISAPQPSPFVSP